MKKYLTISIIIGVISYICFIYQVPFTKTLVSFCTLINSYILSQKSVNLPTNGVEKSVERLFTKNELSKYKGENGKLYLSILGNVFDVTKGKRYYGPGESYHGFAGRDASKAFITGDFTDEGLIDDLSDLTLSDLSSLRDWLERYKKDYIYKGKLIGRFYDSKGNSTPYLKEIQLKFLEADKITKQNEDYNIRYPPCNLEWSQETGSRVWCSNKSGGVKRNWVGVPRKLYLPGWSDYRCACIKENSEELIDKGKLKIYENCDPNAESCFVKN